MKLTILQVQKLLVSIVKVSEVQQKELGCVHWFTNTHPISLLDVSNKLIIHIVLQNYFLKVTVYLEKTGAAGVFICIKKT